MTTSTPSPIDRFLAGKTFAVAGASRERHKYGNMVHRAYRQRDLRAYPVHPHAEAINDEPAFARLNDLPGPVHGVSIITPPAASLDIVREAIALGIRHLWFQPGAEHPEAIAEAEAAGVNVIAGGPCILVSLQFRDE